MSFSQHFDFDVSIFTYFFFTFDFGFPWALCMKQNWKAKHSLIDGKRLQFTGNGGSLILLWIKWCLLLIITVGIYSFWLQPNLQKWIIQHTDFADEN